MFRTLVSAVLVAAAVLTLGCATSTKLDAQWVNPEFAGKRSLHNVMIVGAVRDSASRRIYEDRMVAALTPLGVKAVQSYKVMPEDGPVTEDRLRRAVAEAGVTHAMVTRIINVTTEVNVSPGVVMGPAWGPGWGWGGGWGPGWGGFAGYYNTAWAMPPQVTTTQNVHADTRVFDAKTAAVLWSAATTTSTAYDTLQKLIDEFVRATLAALGYDVRVNDPYKGVELVRAYSDPRHRRHSLQVEINKRLYMAEATRSKHAGFESLQRNLQQMLEAIIDYVQRECRRG